MSYEIIKGLELPKVRSRHTYPFRQMAVGDAFKVEPDRKIRVRGAASAHERKNPGVKFSVRTTDTGTYCFRLA